MMGFGGIIWIVLLIPVIMWFLNKYNNDSNLFSWKRNDDSISILNNRYANGEISKEEFHMIKNDLMKV